MLKEADVRKIAELARLELTPQEVALYTQQLGAIFDYVSALSKIDTKNVAPLVTPTEMVPHFREDEIQPSLGAEKTCANAPEKSGNLFKVPAVL
jgi:aspartyl-tRNA(Asn)/glutamyl-tRNA(Gln) amidotransferase subunit C